MSSTYFEGQAGANPLAQRGYSRDHRPDCLQVCLALGVTREGMPLGYEVFPGNRTDVTTVEEIVETMEARYGVAQRIWVMDRGMTSEENLAWRRKTRRRSLVGTPKSELRKWARQIEERVLHRQLQERRFLSDELPLERTVLRGVHGDWDRLPAGPPAFAPPKPRPPRLPRSA